MRATRPRYWPVREIAIKAMENGGSQVTPTRWEWDISGKCRDPVFREVWARSNRETAPSITVDLTVRCRQCEMCLYHRSMEWTDRAELEVERATRTWFGSMTLTPEEHEWARLRATVKLAAKGRDFDALTEKEQFAARHREIGRLVTLWLKRVRKESGARLRYLLVAEAHKTGLPHYHCLIHEWGEVPVKERQLRLQWMHGFSMFKLVDQQEKAAAYVCKYLAKSSLARVRASRNYGGSYDLGILSFGGVPSGGEPNERKNDQVQEKEENVEQLTPTLPTFLVGEVD